MSRDVEKSSCSFHLSTQYGVRDAICSLLRHLDVNSQVSIDVNMYLIQVLYLSIFQSVQ